ncbi:MAG: hypothetical protein IID30_00550 [Planctomycetes bacterium]|nr:hypothetical protein [Planctomycetota bacterium]
MAVVILGLALILLPRRYAVIPMIIMACFIAPAQRIVFLTLDFNLLRLMVLFGWMRLMLRQEVRGLRWRTIDYVIILWLLSGTMAMTLLHFSSQTFIYRLGIMFDAAGMYFLFRCLIRDWSDIDTIAVSVVWISIPVAFAFLLERHTGRNIFSIFGGVPEYTLIRNGSLRCQGAYAHPILAGAFWASLLPIIIALGAKCDWRRPLAVLGLVTSSVMIVTSGSSTPIFAAIIALVVMAMYPLRMTMVYLRWGAVAGILILHMVMNNPVWHLLARIDLAGGSTGWYRFKLIDDFFTHFGEWWLLGTKSTAHWWDWGSNDITNQYVLEGVNGGLLTLTLFILLIILAFRGVKRFQSRIDTNMARRVMAWAVGASLFVHCVIFIGVSYFGQIQLLWFLTLAMTGSLASASDSIRRIVVFLGNNKPQGVLTRASDTPTSPIYRLAGGAGKRPQEQKAKGLTS